MNLDCLKSEFTPSSTSRVGRVPQEQPTPHLDETGEENKPKATEYTSPAERRGNGKPRTLTSGSRSGHNRAVPQNAFKL